MQFFLVGIFLKWLRKIGIYDGDYMNLLGL